MERLSGRKKAAWIGKHIKRTVAVLAAAGGLLGTQLCFGGETGAPGNVQGAAEPGANVQAAAGPEANVQDAEIPAAGTPEGEGMLLPSQDSTGKSVFSKGREAVTDEKMSALLTQLEAELPEQNGDWSLYVCDLYNNSEGSISSCRMQAASLIKLYIMGAVYENYDILTDKYGQSTIDSCLYSMITVSDNEAANTLTGYLGGGDPAAGMAAVNSFCQAHGFEDTSMERMLLQSSAQGDNDTSAADCGHFLKAVYEGESQEYPYADAMFALLEAQTRRNKIPAQLPAEVGVANKTGELSDVENDAAVIYNVENELVIVFMSENLVETGAAQSTIASVSRKIYDYYNE